MYNIYREFLRLIHETSTNALRKKAETGVRHCCVLSWEPDVHMCTEARSCVVGRLRRSKRGGRDSADMVLLPWIARKEDGSRKSPRIWNLFISYVIVGARYYYCTLMSPSSASLIVLCDT